MICKCESCKNEERVARNTHRLHSDSRNVFRWREIVDRGHFTTSISPGSNYPFYIVNYYKNWVTASWTHSTFVSIILQALFRTRNWIDRLLSFLYTQPFVSVTVGYISGQREGERERERVCVWERARRNREGEREREREIRIEREREQGRER